MVMSPVGLGLEKDCAGEAQSFLQDRHNTAPATALIFHLMPSCHVLEAVHYSQCSTFLLSVLSERQT
jgi:hypothetical protein